MKQLSKKIRILAVVAYAGVLVAALAQPAHAIPFGEGKFGAYLFGSPTSLSVALGGNVNLTLAPSGSQFTANGAHTVTVTTSDVFGYTLYAYALGNSAMQGGSNTIPASGNGTAAPLAVNTWGYNIDASSNYLGLTTTPRIIKTATAGPYPTGDNTTVTYGVLTDITKPAGSYSVSVVYTASVPIQ